MSRECRDLFLMSYCASALHFGSGTGQQQVVTTNAVAGKPVVHREGKDVEKHL